MKKQPLWKAWPQFRRMISFSSTTTSHSLLLCIKIRFLFQQNVVPKFFCFFYSIFFIFCSIAELSKLLKTFRTRDAKSSLLPEFNAIEYLQQPSQPRTSSAPTPDSAPPDWACRVTSECTVEQNKIVRNILMKSEKDFL